jgi:methyl-accepting chemotaxis protein
VDSTSSGIEVINANMGLMEDIVSGTTRRFDVLAGDFENSSSELSRIASAIEELSVTNREIHRQVTDIHGLSKEVESLLNASASSAKDMNRRTEELLDAVSTFRIGDDALEAIIERATGYRDLIRSKMQEIWKSGINIFDTDYKPVQGTRPQKYKTVYDDIFDRELQPIYDRMSEDMGAIYSVGVDVNGYVPTVPSKISKPMTGNYEVDIKHSRQKKMYTATEAEIRRAKNTKPFLLQTYLRDTGDIINDLSLPIVIDGRHWGAFIVGVSLCNRG